MICFLGISVFLIVVLGGSYYAYKLAFFNDIRDDDIYHVPNTPQYQAQAEKMRASVRKMADCPYEQVYITARDGITLAARYYHFVDGAPLQIQMHGYRGSALRDFCGGHALARKMGHNALTVDQRAHGKSGGNVITFGIKERFDCLSWIQYANQRFGKQTPIILSGVSMGASTVLMASELDLPENVVGVIADCPYSAPGAIIQKVCKDMKFPPKLLYPFVVLAGLMYGHFRIWDSSAEKAVIRTKIPALVIHGEDDRFVPCEMSRAIRRANREKVTLETFPEAGHGLSYLLDPQRYETVVRSFMEKCLGKE